MTVIAHAGDWLVDLIYLAPLLVICAVLGVTKIREGRREGTDETTTRARPTTKPPSSAKRTTRGKGDTS